MPYPIQQGSPSWGPSSPRPGGIPRPWSIPPRPANDPIRTPTPANDNGRIRGAYRGIGRKVYYGRVAYNVISMWYRLKTVKEPPLDGYIQTLNCGQTGGPFLDIAGFPSCSGPFLVDAFALGAGVTANRPPIIYQWGPVVGPGPGTTTYYNPGIRWERVVTAGQSQVTVETVTRTEYVERTWEWTETTPWIVPFDYPNPFPMPYRSIPTRPDSPLPERTERGPSPRPRPGPRPDNPLFPGPGWEVTFPNPRPVVRPTYPPVIGPGTDPGTRPNPRPARPRPREKEKKVYAKIKGAAARLVSGATETADFVEAIYEALPEKLRKKLEKKYRQQAIREGRWVTVPPQQKAIWVYRYWKQVDIVQAMKNLGVNEVEDRVIGKLAQGARETSRRAGGIVGVLTGPAI